VSPSLVMLVSFAVTTGQALPIIWHGSVALYPIEAQILHHTNLQRQRHGLPPLELDERLLKSARSHCQWMCRRDSLQHTTAPVAENIAWGQSSAAEVVRDWMNSPGHRANILSRLHRRIGIAAYAMPGGRIYWCQQFSQ
jgi:uncharacterized protein YkwD